MLDLVRAGIIGKRRSTVGDKKSTRINGEFRKGEGGGGSNDIVHGLCAKCGRFQGIFSAA